MADKKTIGIYKAYLKEHLSKKRYTHSVNVANSAVELAKRYDADADKKILRKFTICLCTKWTLI